MDDKVITSDGADQNNEVVTTTTTSTTTTTTQPRRSQRLIENQNGQTATTCTPRAPRAPRPIDPVQRRKKAWSQLWEPWRIETIATYLQISGPEVVERLRTKDLDEMWKTDPQQASVYEDALKFYDERVRAAGSNAVAPPEAGPSSQSNAMGAPEAEATNSESTISAPESQIAFDDRSVASADLEAALTLVSLRYGGNTQDYIGYGASERSMGLQPFNSVNAPTGSNKSMPLDGVSETPVPDVTGKGAPSPMRISQTSGVRGTSTRWKGKQPVAYPLTTHGRSSRAGVPAANDPPIVADTTSSNNDDTFDATLIHTNNISKILSKVSRGIEPPTHSTECTNNVVPATLKFPSTRTSIVKKVVNNTLESPTTLRRSKRKVARDSENEDVVFELTDHVRSASTKKPKPSCKKRKTVEESPMLLRSKRKVIHIEEDENDNFSSPEEDIEEPTKSPGKQVTQQRTQRRRSARKIVYHSDDEAETFPANIKDTPGSKKAKKEEAEEKSPVLRRIKRKLTRVVDNEDEDLPDDDLPIPKRSKKAVKKVKKAPVDEEDIDDSSPEDARPTPKSSKKVINKSKKTSTTEEDEDDDEDEEEVAPVKRRKQAPRRATSTLIHPPANLPLRAPANHPDIPDGALALNEHFKKNTPRPLGVQLPINRNRTRWEWIPYNTRKVANANFDWADDQQRKDANRFRQQRIRRRLTEHGYIHDGRKNH